MTFSLVKYAAICSFGYVSVRLSKRIRPPAAMIWLRNGSLSQTASTFPEANCAGMSGNGISTNFTAFGSPPAFSTAALMVTSPMLFSALIATFLPTRSFAVRRVDPLATRTALTSAAGLPLELDPLATASSGTPFSRAVSRDTTLLKPNWSCPERTAGTIAAPPCAGSGTTSRPRLLKKPFCTPR